MPYRGDIFTQGQYYHIYNRGGREGENFLQRGELPVSPAVGEGVRPEVRRGGDCLLPDAQSLSFSLAAGDRSFSVKVYCSMFNAYVQALNIQQGRTGTLFEGRFKHKRVDTWEYLIVLCRYIHRNPVEAGLVKKPEDWAYSNYREWIGLRDGVLVDRIFVHDHFSSAEEYVQFVNDVEDEKKSYEKIGKYLFD